MKNILFTGATGFIGSCIATRLMMDGHVLQCVARLKKGAVAEERILRKLLLADALMGYENGPSFYAGKYSAVEANFSNMPCLEITPDAIFHAAGDPRFADTNRAEIMEANLTSTKLLLAYATKNGIKEFHYIGSAMIHNFRYVRNVFETTACDRYGYVNPYTESKCLAEKALLAWGRIPGNRVFIYSPSIVIGHRETGFSTSFTGWYQFMEPLNRLIAVPTVKKVFGNYLHNLPFNVLGDPRATINLVTIDYVVDIAAKLFAAGQPGLYHITNANPPIIEELLQWGLEVIGISGLHIGQPKSDLSKLETILQRGITRAVKPYEAFTSFAPRFSQRNVRNVLRSQFYAQPEITPDVAQKLLRFAVRNDFNVQRVEATLHLHTQRTKDIIKMLFEDSGTASAVP